MMRSEFIERTNFEPTADEYVEIENEYMGTDLDKDAFCKMWKKQGGAERLMRIRARRIEDLEMQLAKKDKLFETRTAADSKRYHELFDKSRMEIQRLEENIEELHNAIRRVGEERDEQRNKADEAERKLAVLKEAFTIITGKEEQE